MIVNLTSTYDHELKGGLCIDGKIGFVVGQIACSCPEGTALSNETHKGSKMTK